ncbi:MAG TPA: carboxypeptidase-like regulatory domain-containing protein [Bryobacteraceae bacterium]|nr:carboxypeptidase-like regulatory domain-containing protein [Bryobacteraceae bacterium]
MRLLLAFMVLASPAISCECARLTICDSLRLPTIFIGEVVDGGISSIRDDPWYSNVDHVRFKVLENYRGLPAGTETVDMELMPIGGMCAPNPYHLGRKYLVMPGKIDGKFVDGPCFQGRDVETAAEDVHQVREYFAGKMPANVHGRVAIAREPSLVDFLLMMGETKPLAGVTISTLRGGKTYSATTDTNGRYTLPLPAGGDYHLRAALKPYTLEDAEISVPGKGCAVQDFGMEVDNTISGRVWDDRGQPLKGAEVGLIDLDRPPPSERHAWFRHAYTEAADLSFTFDNVPIGRYLLVFNPNGPQPRDRFDLPFESTYYPLGRSRAKAEIIEIKSGGVHLTGMDLIAGEPVEFRQVTVQVKFQDGTPMNTAQIRCVGLPLQPGDFPWIFEKPLIRGDNGVLRFQAPANRKLQLEIKDSFRRDLKGSYTSTHEPGLTPIRQEVVVTP